MRAAPESIFIEVCAVAPKLMEADPVAAAARPLDVMLVLDRSPGSSAVASWPAICRGLDRLIAQLRSIDRISIIVCGERPRLVALRSDAASLAALLPELLREPVAMEVDFDAAFRLAAAVGRREGAPRRIVAIGHADSFDRCRREARAAVSAWQVRVAADAAAASGGAASFVVIDPEAAGIVAEGMAVDFPGRVAADAVAIGRAMAARVFGRPTLASAGCRLEVVFDPARVGAYRLVGHRQNAADALAAEGVAPIDLHYGECVRVVYEITGRESTGREITGRGDRRTSSSVPGAAAVSAMFASNLPGGGSHRVRVAWDGGLSAGTETHGPSVDGRGGLPTPHGCELLLAVAVGEIGGASVHSDPWRQSSASVTALASRWRARGDVSPLGGMLIDCLERQGILAGTTGR